jgi:hypothetical protein
MIEKRGAPPELAGIAFGSGKRREICEKFAKK